MSVRQGVEFYVLLPVAMGVFLAMANAGLQEFQSVGYHFLYMTMFSTLSWGCYGLASKLVSLVLRPWQPSLLLVLLVGHVVGGFGLWWPLRDLLNLGFEDYLRPGSAFGPFWPPPKDNLIQYIAITAQGTVWWLLANWVDFRYRRVPRFGFVPPDRRWFDAEQVPVAADDTEESGQLDHQEADPAPARPRLIARLPEKLQTAEVIALEAAEHYTKVYTTAGSTLLRLRFSDAILEIEPRPQSGIRVHRSFWINRHAVERVVHSGRRMTVKLRSGLEVPVSRSYRQHVQTALSGRISSQV